MEQKTRRSGRPKTSTRLIALATGLVALTLLFVGSGNAADPPTCYSLFGYVVPCARSVALVVAAAVAGVVGLGLSLRDRRG